MKASLILACSVALSSAHPFENWAKRFFSPLHQDASALQSRSPQHVSAQGANHINYNARRDAKVIEELKRNLDLAFDTPKRALYSGNSHAHMEPVVRRSEDEPTERKRALQPRQSKRYIAWDQEEPTKAKRALHPRASKRFIGWDQDEPTKAKRALQPRQSKRFIGWDDEEPTLAKRALVPRQSQTRRSIEDPLDYVMSLKERDEPAPEGFLAVVFADGTRKSLEVKDGYLLVTSGEATEFLIDSNAEEVNSLYFSSGDDSSTFAPKRDALVFSSGDDSGYSLALVNDIDHTNAIPHLLFGVANRQISVFSINDDVVTVPGRKVYVEKATGKVLVLYSGTRADSRLEEVKIQFVHVGL